MIVAVVFLFMTVMGLLVTPDYGIPWDEHLEMGVLGSNIRECIGIFQGEDKEPLQSATGIEFPDRDGNRDIDHGESVYYPIAPMFFVDLGVDGVRAISVFIHMYIFCLFMLGVLALYFITKSLTGEWRYGLLASLFLYLSPRFFAEGHYNSKDIVALSMILLCFWFFIKLSETREMRYAVLFALFGAFAANMRITGAAFFGLAGIMYLVTLTVRKEWNRKNFLLGLVALVLFLLFYYVLTPVAWKNPIGFVSYVIGRSSNFAGWTGYVYYMGSQYRPVPWHYIPVMFAITTPVLIVLLTVFGNIISIGTLVRTKVTKIFEGPQKYYLMSLIFVWIFLGYAIIRQPILFNSWRHFYFLYGQLIILSIFGLKWLIDKLKKNGKRVIIMAVALQLLASGVIIATSHPYEFVYYNFIAGADPGSRFEMDYWNIAQPYFLMRLVDENPSEDIITVVSVDEYTQYGLYQAYIFLPQEYKARLNVLFQTEGGIPEEADYLIVNPIAHYLMKDKTNEGTQIWFKIGNLDTYMQTYDKAMVLDEFGSEFMIIYKIPE